MGAVDNPEEEQMARGGGRGRGGLNLNWTQAGLDWRERLKLELEEVDKVQGTMQQPWGTRQGGDSDRARGRENDKISAEVGRQRYAAEPRL